MKPSLDYFLPYQRAWIDEPARLALGEKSRRIGFTHAHAYAAVEGRVRGGSNYWHSSADKSASIEFVEECERWAKVFNVAAEVVEEKEVIGDEEIATMQMRFGNGTKIVAGTSNPKFFRSKGGHVGLDEFAFHERARELFKAAHASALFWNYSIRIWSTHNGEGSLFNRMLKAARSGQLKAAVHRVSVLDAVEQGIVEKIRRLPGRDDNARREWLAELRSTILDEQTWNEEYLCVPSSDQSSLLTYDLIQGCEVENLSLSDVAALDPGKTYYAGFDVGRRRDLSVLWVLEKVGDVFWARVLRTLNKVNFSAQEALLDQLMGNRAVKRLCLDETGIGMMLAERLRQKWGSRVEGLTFTAAVKSELAMPLLRLFQDRLVRVPADTEVREDLHQVRKIVTAANNVRLDADRNEAGHADRFWALALAYHAADAVKLPLPAPRAMKPVGW